jgi:hypothetical protein
VPSKHVHRNDEQLVTSFSSSINDILKKERGWRINEQLRDFFLLIKIGMDTIFVLL